MDDINRKNIILIFYIITVLILAVIYFSMPERTAFLENQLKWWSEMWSVLTSG